MGDYFGIDVISYHMAEWANYGAELMIDSYQEELDEWLAEQMLGFGEQSEDEEESNTDTDL